MSHSSNSLMSTIVLAVRSFSLCCQHVLVGWASTWPLLTWSSSTTLTGTLKLIFRHRYRQALLPVTYYHDYVKLYNYMYINIVFVCASCIYMYMYMYSAILVLSTSYQTLTGCICCWPTSPFIISLPYDDPTPPHS